VIEEYDRLWGRIPLSLSQRATQSPTLFKRRYRLEIKCTSRAAVSLVLHSPHEIDPRESCSKLHIMS